MSARMSPVPRKALYVAIAVLAVVGTGGAIAGSPDVPGVFSEKAHGHTKFSNGKWVFRGRTIDKSGVRADKIDPVNVIFMGHPHLVSYQTLDVRRHINAHMRWKKPSCSAGQQRMVWRKRNNNNTRSDKDDLQMASKTCGITGRWHARLWDDVDHKDYTANHAGVKRWMVGGVHHEGFAPHTIDKDFDVARRKLVFGMASSSFTPNSNINPHPNGKKHCAWPKWRQHPGARGRISGVPWRNSGWIGRISLKHTPNC